MPPVPALPSLACKTQAKGSPCTHDHMDGMHGASPVPALCPLPLWLSTFPRCWSPVVLVPTSHLLPSSSQCRQCTPSLLCCGSPSCVPAAAKALLWLLSYGNAGRFPHLPGARLGCPVLPCSLLTLNSFICAAPLRCESCQGKRAAPVCALQRWLLRHRASRTAASALSQPCAGFGPSSRPCASRAPSGQLCYSPAPSRQGVHAPL